MGLNRGIAYVAHHAWIMKIPTVTEEENLWLPAHTDTLQTPGGALHCLAACGYWDPHFEFPDDNSIMNNENENEKKHFWLTVF